MRLFFFTVIFVCNFLCAQNTAKTDTIFSVRYNYDRIEHSKIQQLTADIKSDCITKEINGDKLDNLEYNTEYSILSMLNEFNKFSKSTIFSDYKYLIYSKFCYKCDFLDDVALIEFHFTQKIKSDTFQKKIEMIISDEEFYNYPNEKLFYHKKVSDNVCYLLISIKDNPNNEIFNELKKRILEID